MSTAVRMNAMSCWPLRISLFPYTTLFRSRQGSRTIRLVFGDVGVHCRRIGIGGGLIFGRLVRGGLSCGRGFGSGVGGAKIGRASCRERVVVLEGVERRELRSYGGGDKCQM